MKLAEYLADYIDDEIPIELAGIDSKYLSKIIQQGIEAFESTEGVKIRIVDVQQRDMQIFINLAKEFIEWTKNKSFCNSGQHIYDKLASYFEEMLK